MAEIDLSGINLSALPNSLLKKYQECGCPKATDKNKLYAVIDEGFVRLGEIQDLGTVSRVVYSDVVAHQNAAEFGRENGIIYFFHTSEKPHKEFPHIHARYAEEEISIYLKDFRVDGHFKSGKKQKEALEYVGKHLQELYDEWNRIINV